MPTDVSLEAMLLTIVAPVALPLGFVLVASVLEHFVETEGGWRGRLVRIGWDVAVFSFGVTSGVFADSQVAAFYGTRDAVSGAIGCIFGSFLAVALMLLLRRQNPYTGFKGLMALVLGALPLAPPLYFHAHALGMKVFGF